jgi:hypothetical protein
MVIKQVKHWMKLRANAAAWKALSDWAEARGARFAQTEEGDGFLIDEPENPLGHLRIEWGPSQRAYIEGQELRVRWELGIHPELQMMVMERGLRDVLERAVFEAYTDTLQTRIDTDTPEEMRWLVMFAQMEQWRSKLAKARFTACSVTKEVATAWADGALSDALALASQDLVAANQPFVMLTQRGNLYLRTVAPEPNATMLQGIAKLAEVGAQEAKRVDQLLGEAATWPNTANSAWHPSTRSPEP